MVLHQVCSRQVCNILKKSSFTKCVQQTHSCVAFAHSDKYHIFGVVSLSSILAYVQPPTGINYASLHRYVCRLKQNGNSLLWLHMFTYIRHVPRPENRLSCAEPNIYRCLQNIVFIVQLFYPFRIKFMKIAAHAHMNDLSIINLVLS